MFKKILAAGFALGAGLAFVSPVAAQEVSFSASADYVSKYVFRGVQLAEDAFQPGVEISSGGFTAGIWHSAPLSGDDFYSEETDYYLSYGFDISESLSASVGVTHYAYPGEDTNTTEVFAGLGFAGPLSPSATLYYDTDLEAWTLEGTAEYSWPLADTLSFDVGGTLGAVEFDGGDFQYASASAAISKAFTDHVSGYVGINAALNSEDTFYDDEAALLAGDVNSGGVWFGVGLSVSQ